jgi:predicted SnoaL-like aldol condensation-catalyzing enzyme
MRVRKTNSLFWKGSTRWFQSTNWIAADILRIKDGIFLEHWDVIQDEATKAESKSGLPMFGETFSK